MNDNDSCGLDKTEEAIYRRQTILPEIGPMGQLKLKNARVVIVGLGGLGSSAALYLAAAGVGTLGLVDNDRVEESNLQRQILHGSGDVGRKKTTSAGERIWDLNAKVNLELFSTTFDAANAKDIIGDFDIALGCVDNFGTRYLLNQTCLELGKPNVFGAAAGWEGQASVFCLPGMPCYRCFFQEPPEESKDTGEEVGVIGTVPGIIGCVQANETLKLIVGSGGHLGGRLLLFNALDTQFREIAVKKDPNCPACGGRNG